MHELTRRTLVLALAGLALPLPALSSPIRYRLDPAASKVGFGFILGGGLQHGTMPIEKADIVIDPANLSRSRADVTLRADAARTGLIYATQAMVGPGVLEVDRYPTIRFVSTRVQLAPDGRLSGGARLRGLLTLRGVTRPIELRADLYRPRGTAPDDLSELTIRLSGSLSRRAFGATAYSDLVADTISLDINAVIRAP